jgi:membrane-associated phospholipid phosphatase
MAAQDADRGVARSSGARAGSATATSGFDPRPLIAILGLGAFAVITWIVASKTVIPFDQPLFDAAQRLGQYLPEWHALSDSANLPLIVIGTAIVVVLLLRRQFQEAILTIVVLAVVTAGSEAVKQAVARPRPPGFDTSLLGVVYSYPSGHILEATTIYGMIAVLLWRSRLPRTVRVIIPIVFVVIIALVAVARVAVGDHYPSDVLAGLVAGIGIVALFSWFTDILARRRAEKAEAKRADDPSPAQAANASAEKST